MRRIVLAAVVLGASFVTAPAAAQTVRLVTSYSIGIGASNYPVNNSGYSIMGSPYHEEPILGGGPPVTINNFNVSVSDGIGGLAFGQGPLSIDFDPVLQTGTIQGSITTNNLDVIMVNLSFFGTQVTTTPPLLSAEIVPTPPQQATVQTSMSRFGRLNGSVSSSATGAVSVPNGGAYISRFVTLVVRT